MFNWIKNLIKKNHTLILKQEWIVGEHEFKKSLKKKKAKKKTKKKTKKKKDTYGKWEGNL
jgi:hypothetical protein